MDHRRTPRRNRCPGITSAGSDGPVHSPGRKTHLSSHYKQHHCRLMGRPRSPAHNASPPAGRSFLLYKYSDAALHPYKRPSGCGNPSHWCWQWGTRFYPGKSWHLKKYSRIPSPVPQMDLSPGISQNHIIRCAPKYAELQYCHKAECGNLWKIPCCRPHWTVKIIWLRSFYAPAHNLQNLIL